MAAPKVSIVTPSFNQAAFLAQTLQSVRAQDYPHVEHIVVDGGSSDGSVDLLRAAPNIRWVSEPDKGQVDAINKGFAMATGEILAWVNSDDTISPDAVRIAVEALERTGADMVYGDLRIIDQDGTHLRMFYGIPFDYRVLLYGIYYIGQQSVFFRRTLLEKARSLRTEFDNAFDFELWLRFARHGRLVYVPELRGQIRRHDAAKSVALAARTWAETARIRREYWKTGGLPAFLGWKPFFPLVNWYYRFKRLREIRKASRTSPRARILMFGYLPPPIYGPAITYQALLRSSFPERFDVTFVNLTVVRDYRELEVFRWRKLGLLLRQLALEKWHLASQRFDFVFYPISLNRNAFLKDTLFVAIARVFRVPIVLYGHGNNLPEFREKSPRWLQRLIDWTIRSAVAATVPGKNLRFNFLNHLREDQVFAVTNGIEVPAKLPAVTKSAQQNPVVRGSPDPARLSTEGLQSYPDDGDRAVKPGGAVREPSPTRPAKQKPAPNNGATLPAVTKPPSRFTVLYLGNLVREKGVFVILDAIPLVKARCPEAHFLFAGAWWSDKDRAAGEALVKERNLSSCTEFTGTVSGVQKWEAICRGDVLVFPTFFRYETLGQVLLEAMGVGLPVIATRRAAIPEIVEEGVNGLFVAEQDPADLAEKIVALANDPALRASMSAANKQKYANTYTIEHYGQRMAAVFDELVARRKK